MSHQVRDGDSWQTLAQRYGVPASSIILANFKTLVPAEVNWYLHHYVGCNRPTHDGRNWMFSASAKPGIIQIPPTRYFFEGETIVARPRCYKVEVEPSKWLPPTEGEGDLGAVDVVNIKPWRHHDFDVGGVPVTSRSGWRAADPDWGKGVFYYNTKVYPLDGTLTTIVIHHTDNTESIATNEEREKGRNFAAIGYHFFIDQSGKIFEGRPLEIMGSHAGEGLKPGPLNDPDFGAVGIVVQGNYDSGEDSFATTIWGQFEDELHGVLSTKPPAVQLKALEKLVGALRTEHPSIQRMLLHSEVLRGGKPTVCPGDQMAPHAVDIRDRLGFRK